MRGPRGGDTMIKATNNNLALFNAMLVTPPNEVRHFDCVRLDNFEPLRVSASCI